MRSQLGLPRLSLFPKLQNQHSAAVLQHNLPVHHSNICATGESSAVSANIPQINIQPQQPQPEVEQPKDNPTESSSPPNTNTDGDQATRTSSGSRGSGGGDTENYSSSLREIAAVIPTPKPKVKNPSSGGSSSGDGNSRTLKKVVHTPNVHGAPSAPISKQKSLPCLKEKKPGVGWKFSSEHVQGKEYLIIKQLGKGGCGEVLLVRKKMTK